MSRKKDTITLSIPPGTKEQLEAIARNLQILWGKEPSISGLIVAIAQQKVTVGQQFTFEQLHVHSLEKAIKLLVDTGFLGDAQTLVELLLAKATLTPEHRQTLFQHVSQPEGGWRMEIERYCTEKKPFRLLYQNSQGDSLEYTIRYAEIAFHDKRFYVDAWCEEVLETPDYPELMYNRCFRLDRIQAILPISGEWRDLGLDSILVQLHFYKGLIKAYEFRQGIDEHEGMERDEEGKIKLRRVWRKTSNPFWLLREIRAYGGDCEVIEPESVRRQAKEDAELMLARYNKSNEGEDSR
jgi:predicted DNA-binding transcriptional regulator YafY